MMPASSKLCLYKESTSSLFPVSRRYEVGTGAAILDHRMKATLKMAEQQNRVPDELDP